jgi:hypothetical protein
VTELDGTTVIEPASGVGLVAIDQTDVYIDDGAHVRRARR